MMKYKVLSKKRSENGEFLLLAVNYIYPSMVKILSKQKLKIDSFVYVDNESVYYKKKYIGKVVESKSSDDIVISTDYTIKYTGGYSVDGNRIFLDKYFPRFVLVNKKYVSMIDTIAKHHELTEKWLVDFGYSYPYAHRLANSVERDFVKLLKVDWESYDAAISKYVRETYKRKLENTPVDLDLLPYFQPIDHKALREIKESMNTEIINLIKYAE